MHLNLKHLMDKKIRKKSSNGELLVRTKV